LFFGIDGPSPDVAQLEGGPGDEVPSWSRFPDGSALEEVEVTRSAVWGSAFANGVRERIF